MRFEVFSSYVKEVAGRRLDAVPTQRGKTHVETEHGFFTGSAVSEKGPIHFAILVVTFDVRQANDADKDVFVLRVSHEVTFQTERLLTDDDAADASIMGPMVHAATGIAFAGTTQAMRLMGNRSNLRFPEVAPTFERDPTQPRQNRVIGG